MSLKKTTTYLFTEVANIFKNDFDKVIKEIGLNGGQVFVLQSLFEEDGQSQIDLANKLGLAPPTINSMVKSLSKNSFVTMKKCPLDGRVVRVYLTRKTIERESQIEEKWLEFEERFFSELTTTEKLVLFQLLEKLKVEG